MKDSTSTLLVLDVAGFFSNNFCTQTHSTLGETQTLVNHEHTDTTLPDDAHDPSSFTCTVFLRYHVMSVST